MHAFNTLADIWSLYDVIEKRHFLSHDIVSAINSLPEEIQGEDTCKYELLGFNFSENSSGKDWGLYYGPQFIFKKNDTNEDIFVPDIVDITKEVIEYWEHRAKQVLNPLLKMRYTGLVLVFKKRILNIEPDFQAINLAHIDALLTVVEGDYCQFETITLDYAERALTLSIAYRNDNLQKRAVDVYYEAHMRLAKDDMHPGIWGRIAKSLVEHRACFAYYEEILVNEQVARFERIKTLTLSEGETSDKYVHVLSDQTDLLSDYYHSIGERYKIERLLEGLLSAIKLSINARGGLWGQGMIQQMQDRYRKYGFDKLANQLFIDLCDLGEMTLKEMKPVEISIPIEQSRIDAFLKDAMKGTTKDILLYFLYSYLPLIEDEKRKLKDKVERAPLLEILPTITIDSSGNPISKVGIGPHAERQRLSHSVYENMIFSAPFMHLHINKMIEQEIMTSKNILEFLRESPLIASEHKEIVQKGLEAYMGEDYLVCCHLLVPQLEAAIRRLFSINGANIMRPKANPAEGNEYQSLDSLLASPDAITYMGEDMANYFRNLLTDQYGWNIRNLLSHGLLGIESFNYGMADRVVHAFMLLGVFKEKQI